ncbi:disease resistance protein RGA2-like isoform X1 [Chenopodium quinoa]|uniref:disease resistance protein RGA2-like isoform X1 n=1 Tax=Chenopodium quinoa TaxID=63459 RepID=UPI000B76D5E3|nr:disease resistance protein RGA2-like isoform X1 [Chenopodium quinoa]
MRHSRQCDENKVMTTLMFSYHQLTNELKSCFGFCSLSPKDYAIEKDVLINLWLAQGYLFPSHEGQSMEDVGEEYVSILLHRCFFYDNEQDECGEVKSFKMHDLLHDLALEVAGAESLMLTSSMIHFGKTIRHLSTTSYAYLNNWVSPSYCSNVTVRTLFQLYSPLKTSGNVAAIISSCRRLRVLDLHDLAIETLPKLGKLLHLRYLDVSGNETMEMLPTSITKLQNLQILKLCNCKKLKQLPEDVSKLVNLRLLNLDGCYRLTHMPAGMDNLKCLHTLTKFVVRGDDSNLVKKGEIIDLKDLVNLKGDLCIEVREFSGKNMPVVTEGAYILKNAHLEALQIMSSDWSVQSEVHETLLEGLYPNHDLSRFEMEGYQGIKLPTWASTMETFLPCLVSIKLSNLHELQHLPSMSQLCHLKSL